MNLRRIVLTASAGVAVLGVAVSADALPVFPGAVGFGVEGPAGRGGTVYRITNLNESGEGSIGACLAAMGPRICVFEVSGVINLTQETRVRNPYITIAGQTAPSPGIMIAGSHLRLDTSDILIQHVTFRRGDGAGGGSAGITVNNYTGKPATNIVINHCSLSWGTDENFTAWLGFGDITVSNTIIADGLRDSPGYEGHGFAINLGPVPDARVAMIGNLVASAVYRSPYSNVGNLALVNNLVYNWSYAATSFSNQVNTQLGGDEVVGKNSVVGNLYVRGPIYGLLKGPGKPIWFSDEMVSTGNQAYLQDNAEVTSSKVVAVAPTDPWSLATIYAPNTRASLEVRSAPVWPTGLTALPVGKVLDSVLVNAGARPADRSPADVKVINDVRNGTGGIVHCMYPSSHYTGAVVVPENVSNCDKSNVGGWPNYAVNRRPLSLPANPNGDDDGDGYTNLEEWLHDMAAAVEGTSADRRPLPPNPLSVN